MLFYKKEHERERFAAKCTMLQKKNAEMTKKMEELEEVDLWFLTCWNIFFMYYLICLKILCSVLYLNHGLLLNVLT